MPSSRAVAVTVLPEESTSAIASRLNSSVYRFVYLLPTWCYFLWNLRSQSPGVHDQGEASAIRRTLQRTSAGGLTTLPTKTRASERRIALPTRCVHSLKRHHEQQQREREAAGTAWQPNGHVFTTVQGGSIDPTNLTRAFTTLLRKAGLRRIRFHDIRHSTATLLLEQGVELVVIKELLGHAHIDVTATVYAHVRLRLQRDAIDTLGRALDHP